VIYMNYVFLPRTVIMNSVSEKYVLRSDVNSGSVRRESVSWILAVRRYRAT